LRPEVLKKGCTAKEERKTVYSLTKIKTNNYKLYLNLINESKRFPNNYIRVDYGYNLDNDP
jgi:hypothetical protein